MTVIWKNECIDKLDNIVDKYNNTYHRTIEKKSAEVKSSTYIDFDFDVENNDKDCKFKVKCKHVTIQKTSQKEFRVGKVIKKKRDKLYGKWKGYDNSLAG